MAKSSSLTRVLALSLTLFVSGVSTVCAQTRPISLDSAHYLYEPTPLLTGEKVWNLGLSFSLLPAPIVEQEAPAPAVVTQIRVGTWKNVSFIGSFGTNYFTNVLITGLQYNFGSNDLSVAFGDALAGFAGYIDMGGEFDKNTAAAIADIPLVRIGHRFGSVAATFGVSGTYVLYARTKIGGLEDRSLDSRFNDIIFVLALEQPFFKKQLITTGLSVTYSRTPYQIWMLYNVFDQYLVIPEFFLSFQL